MSSLEFLAGELEELRARGLLRYPADHTERMALEERARRRGRCLLDVSSNDYLGHGSRAVSRETLDACLELTLGSGASRLLGGTRHPHQQLETLLASWVGQPTALLFSSGYAANVGVLSALLRPQDLVISDALNHASIIDGCRLARPRLVVTPHLDLSAIEDALRSSSEHRRFVITEAYFSMDADSPDLPALSALCARYGAALIVDEAHSLGVFGPRGSGLCAAHGICPDVLIGTLGKAVGAHGAFAAADTNTRTWLWNRARSFVFSTAPSPLLSALVAARVVAVQSDDQARHRLHTAVRTLSSFLRRHAIPLPPRSHGPVFPVLLGLTERALAAAAALRNDDILAHAIRPPTVPHGTARLRISLTAHMAAPELTRLSDALCRLCGPFSPLNP